MEELIVTELAAGLDSSQELARQEFEWEQSQTDLMATDRAVAVADRPSDGAVRRLARRIAREPFVHFIILGAALFALNHHLEERSRFTRVTITQDQVRGIAENYRLQYGGYPSPELLNTLVDDYIKEEIFYHEALKLGLDRDDEIIRRRLVQKYEFLQQDLAAPSEPTQSQLLDYYNAHLAQYRRPETVTFTHVYFSPDLRGENGAREAARDIAENLNAQGFSRAVDEGDRFPGSYDFSALSREELGRVFGKEGLAETIFAADPNPLRLGRWSPPLRSGFGWHTVYVSGRQPSRQATFNDAREDVRRDYIESERKRRNDVALEKLRKNFEIVRERSPGPAGGAAR
jgi:hypothetical protein